MTTIPVHTGLAGRDLAPLGTAIASVVVAVLTILLTFSQPTSTGPAPYSPGQAAANPAGS